MAALEATVPNICQRCHDINTRFIIPHIKGATARRTWPASVKGIPYPCLVPLPPGRMVHTRITQSTTHSLSDTFTITAIVGSFLAGIPNESAQLMAEELIDIVRTAYFARDKLILDGHILTNLKLAQLGDSEGIMSDDDGIAYIRWPLTVTYYREVQQVTT